MERPRIDSSKICIMATNGFEQSELIMPLEHLRQAGATVHIASLQMGDIKGWDQKNWGNSVPVDMLIKDVHVSDYDMLVLPGGQMNPDILRCDDKAVQLVKEFAAAGKPIAAICHAPWLLIEAGIAGGRTMTSYHSIRTDVINAGANFVDEEVVNDSGLITSRSPEDLPAFIDEIIGLLSSIKTQQAVAGS